MNKLQEFSATRGGLILNRLAAATAIVAFLFRISLMITASVNANTVTGMSSVNQVTDTIIMVLVVYLGYIHGDIYKLNLGKKQKLDERLTALRRGIYEKSFQVLVTMIFIAMFVFNFAALGSGGFSLHFSQEAGNSFSIGALFFIFSIPALLATMQRKS